MPGTLAGGISIHSAASSLPNFDNCCAKLALLFCR
jgi:hypothetical protein